MIKAMILAAGYGTRLAPLTGGIPKALVGVAGVPMIARAIDAVRRAGCDEIIVNTHHLASLVEEHFAATDYGAPVRLIHEPEILGTGGALLNARPWLEDADCILLHNADIVTDFDLRSLIALHLDRRPFATLTVHRRHTSRAVLFDAGMRFLGKEVWKADGASFPADALLFGFCGIHVIDPSIFRIGYPEGFSDIFDIYRKALSNGARIEGHECEGMWHDLGTIEKITACEEELAAKNEAG
jgi:NDP-sugar pyrophosphorylase family protein